MSSVNQAAKSRRVFREEKVARSRFQFISNPSRRRWAARAWIAAPEYLVNPWVLHAIAQATSGEDQELTDMAFEEGAHPRMYTCLKFARMYNNLNWQRVLKERREKFEARQEGWKKHYAEFVGPLPLPGQDDFVEVMEYSYGQC